MKALTLVAFLLSIITSLFTPYLAPKENQRSTFEPHPPELQDQALKQPDALHKVSVVGQVRVNGQIITSGSSIQSESVITTEPNSSAVVDLGKRGRVELLPNTTVQLVLDDNLVSARLDEGRVRLSTAAGILARVTTKDSTAVADIARPNVFIVDIECGATAIATQTGLVELRTGANLKQIAAGHQDSAGIAQPGTRCTRFTMEDKPRRRSGRRQRRQTRPAPSATINAVARPTPSPATSPLSKAAIDKILEGMEWGNVAFNAPNSMEFDVAKRVILELSLVHSVDDLKKMVAEKEGVEGDLAGARIKVADEMQAVLTGDGFQITAVTQDTLPISKQSANEWKWDVRPLRSGKLRLHLVLNAYVNVDNKGNRIYPIKTYEKVYDVDVPWQNKPVIAFVLNNLQWLWITLVVPAGGLVWKLRKRKNKSVGFIR